MERRVSEVCWLVVVVVSSDLHVRTTSCLLSSGVRLVSSSILSTAVRMSSSLTSFLSFASFPSFLDSFDDGRSAGAITRMGVRAGEVQKKLNINAASAVSDMMSASDLQQRERKKGKMRVRSVVIRAE